MTETLFAVYFAGRKVARRTAATGAVAYYFADHLGSTGVLNKALA